MWSQTTIPGEPRLLIVDGSGDVQGWEAGFCDRIWNVLARKGFRLVGEAPLRVRNPEDLAEPCRVQDSFNCMFLACHGQATHSNHSSLAAYWDWLSQQQGLDPKLLAVCTWEDHDADTSESILESGDNVASLAIAPQSPLSPRAAGLFYMKFFTELGDHSSGSINGRMVWFSCTKARELLRRRRLPGQIGMRC